MKQEFTHFEVGVTKIKEYANVSDGYLLDYNYDSGFIFFAFLNNISEEELNYIRKQKNDFEIRFAELSNIGFFCVKFGDLMWGDCTYEPKLYGNDKDRYPNINIYDKNKGFSFSIIVVDPAKEGLVCGLRVIGLGHNFSKNIANWYKENKDKPFSKDIYFRKIDEVQSRYSSAEIAQKSTYIYKLSN